MRKVGFIESGIDVTVYDINLPQKKIVRSLMCPCYDERPSSSPHQGGVNYG